MADALLSKSSIKSVRHTGVYYDIMKVDFHSNGSQRQSAEQQKPGCRCILTVGASDEGFLLLKHEADREHQAEVPHCRNPRK